MRRGLTSRINGVEVISATVKRDTLDGQPVLPEIVAIYLYETPDGHTRTAGQAVFPGVDWPPSVRAKAKELLEALEDHLTTSPLFASSGRRVVLETEGEPGGIL